MKRSFLLAGLAACLVAIILSTPALADLAANIISVVIKTDYAVALTAAAPTGSTDGAGGYSIAPGGAGGSRGVVARAWCELQTNGTSITGGSIRWWKATDGGWGEVPGLDETGIATTGVRWVSQAIDVAGPDGRVYCQPKSITETGAGLDGGLMRTYGFRVETR